MNFYVEEMELCGGASLPRFDADTSCCRHELMPAHDGMERLVLFGCYHFFTLLPESLAFTFLAFLMLFFFLCTCTVFFFTLALLALLPK